MNTRALFVLLMLAGMPNWLAAQEGPVERLSDEEFEILSEIPEFWIEVTISDNGIPVIEEYCDAGTGTVSLEMHDVGTATVTFFYGQEAEVFEIISVTKEGEGYWLQIEGYQGYPEPIGFFFATPGSGMYGEWDRSYGGGLYVDSNYSHCIDVIEAEGCH